MTKPDNNYLSVADVSDKHLKNCFICPKAEGLDCADFDDILKFSHAENCSIQNSVISGMGVNRENAIDMNRLCSNVSVVDCKIVSGKQNAITIKGGCKSIIIKNCVIVPGAGNCDIDLGNFSNQSQSAVIGVGIINVTRSDGNPVRVRVINSEIPYVSGGNVVITRPFWGRFPIWNIYSFMRSKGLI
jgi:hypothetical protein